MERQNATRRSWTGWIVSNGLRLWVWYLILTVAFRCPSSPADLTASSPRVCPIYLDAKSRVVTVAQPYYDSYAASYVEGIRPYYDTVNTKLYTPVYDFATSSYRTFAAPHVEQAQLVAQRQWEASLRPQLERLGSQASDLYEGSLSPYVGQAHDALRPHIDSAQAIAAAQYQSVIVPTYELVQPYAQSAYDQSYKFTKEVGVPYSYWAAETAVVFLQKRVWPPIRVLYGENIQPQLAKIQERLSSYNDGKRLESIVESVDAAQSASSSASSSSVSATEHMSTTDASFSSTSSSTKAKTSSKATQEEEDYAGELKAWREKFSKAASRGAADLDNRIAEITDNQISKQAQGTGDALLTSLDEAAKDAVHKVQTQILNIIRAIPEDDDEATDQVIRAAKGEALIAVRAGGMRVKDAAQHLRSWRKEYNEETEKLVNMAFDSTLEVVNNIRDLGLQEIGMRWATLEGVSYKDWSEYHDLRKTFADWRDTVQEVVSSHKGPDKANAAGEEVESRGMAIAEDAAKELARLKDVAVWKVDARDGGDDFSTRFTPPGVAKAASRAKEQLSSAADSIVGSTSTQGVFESMSSDASSLAQPVVDKAASVAEDLSAGASSVLEAAGGSASAASSSASSGASSASSSASSLAKSAASSASSAGSSASSSASSKAPSSASSASSRAGSGVSSVSSAGSSAASSAASAVSDGAAAMIDQAHSSASSLQASLSAIRSSASKKAARSSSRASAAESVSSASSVAGSAVSAASESIASSASSISSSHESARSSKSRESVKSKVKSSATHAASKASGKAEDVVDAASKKASAASQSIASKVSEAGDKYTDVTSSLQA